MLDPIPKQALVWLVLLLAAGAIDAPGAVTEASGPFQGGAAAKPESEIDRLVFGRLEQLGLAPAPVCSDAVFLRRAYLDVIGTLPTAREAGAFLQDRDPNKRRVLIDKLLARDEFADYWAMKWSDLLRIKAEFPINLWPNAAQEYHHWVRECVKDNVPYDRFARELLTSSGSNFRVAPVNFYRAMQSRDAAGIAQTVALTFMGARAERWPRERLDGLAAFFSQVGYKSTAEWKEEIVYFDPGKTNSSKAGVLPDGTAVEFAPGRDPREIFADWLVAPKNPWFARALANRVWSWLLGRGIVHEPDDFRPDNPPSNPELLAWLEHELVSSHYDVRHLYRVILNSQTYQLGTMVTLNTPLAEANFAAYPLRRLEAEVLIDALNQITGSTEQYTSPIPEPFTFIPESQRSIALPDGSISSSFLELFGRPSRDTGLEAERNNRATAAQELHLLNSSHIQRKIEQSPKLQNLFQSSAPPREVISGLYLMILSRYPTARELDVIAAYGKADALSPRQRLVDVTWAMVNSAEFLYRH